MSTDTQIKLSSGLYAIFEKLIDKAPYHTELERLDDLILLAAHRADGPVEGDRAPQIRVDPNAARNASANTVADQSALAGKVDALTAQVQALVAAMAAGAGMATPVSVPAGTGDAVVGGIVSDAPAPVTAVASGDGTAPPPIAPPATEPAAPVAVPAGTGNAAPPTPPPAPIPTGPVTL